MKRIILFTTTIFTLAISNAFGQSPLPKGANQLNFGVGLSGWGIPLYIGLDHSVHKDVTLGGEITYRSYNENWKTYKYKHDVFGFSFNGNYHFNTLLNIPRNWDFYGGLNIGFYVWSSPTAYSGNNTSGLGLGAQLGGRYYFNEKVGVNLELGGGNAISGGKFGLTVKL